MSFMAFLQIAGAVKQYGDSQSAASDIKEAGEKNAQLAELETKERLRRSRYKYCHACCRAGSCRHTETATS